MATARIRYLVDDVDDAVAFYVDHLGFTVRMRPGPGFAMLEGDGLTLLLNAVGAGGGGRAGDATDRPRPGGWNRIQLVVDDLDGLHARLAEAGVASRGGLVEGQGGRQVLVEDPSGNPVELFEPMPR